MIYLSKTKYKFDLSKASVKSKGLKVKLGELIPHVNVRRSYPLVNLAKIDRLFFLEFRVSRSTILYVPQ